ncbi:MAG TPA: cupredoxin domain-containing protein [Nitrososphaeraceae archaeon]|nr:cupredoxin domain-containing protein [Nitrososphaeraceae archaeon]
MEKKKYNKTLHGLVMSALMLSTILVFSISFNWQGNSMQLAPIAKALYGQSPVKPQTSGTTAAASSSSSNTIQLSTKEESPGIYRWIGVNTGTINPTLKIPTNMNSTIKIQNPTDTKHELIIDTGSDVLPSSDDINPNSSGQLSFKPTAVGTFTYHCAYHPFTMKGTVQVVSGQ